MSMRVRIEHGQDAGKTWRLPKAGTYVIGRVPPSGIRVLDMKVSKEHARVVLQGEDGVLLEDLGSRHGTLLNGQPVQGVRPVKAGDEIRLGLSILRVLSDGPADETLEPTGAEPPLPASEHDRAAGTPPRPKKVFPPDALVDTEIGGYKVLRKIGQGGMGSVYVAEQLSLHREVALKVLSEKFTDDRAFVDQFVNEARSAAALNHPNVVQVYDVGRENGRYYFSMEYVPGGSLEERLAENGPPPWTDALNWMIDASNALIFAAKREILHRDVKPDNLMLAEDGSAKLCDLGLAKKAANADLLAAGIIGTPAFISPEAIRRKKEIDARSDLYSLGCTFYRVLTGGNPYPGSTVKDILLGHLRNPVPRVSAKNHDVPKELDDVVYRLMQKEPDERFASPDDLLQSLDRIRVQHGLEAHGLRPPSRKPLMIALAVLVVGLGVALYLVLTSATAPTGPTPQEIEQQKRAEEERLRVEKEYGRFQVQAVQDRNEIEKRRIEGHLTLDNATDPRWGKLSNDFKDLAGRLEGNADYGDRKEIKDLVRVLRVDAENLQKDVQDRIELGEQLKSAKEETAKALDADLGALRKAYDDAMAAAEKVGPEQAIALYAKAYLAVDPERLADIRQRYEKKLAKDALPDSVPAELRQRLGDEPLLGTKEQIDPRVTKLFPGDPAGAELRDAAAKAAKAAYDAAAKQVTDAFVEPTHEKYRTAADLAEALTELLPDAADPKLGPLGTEMASWRQEAEELSRRVDDAEQALRAKELSADHDAYETLLRSLRKPSVGLLYKLDLDAAEKQAKDAAAAMHDPTYRALALSLAGDAAAIRALYQHIQASFPDGWSSDKVSVPDDRGETTTAKVREVGAKSIRLGQDERTWLALGPQFVVGPLLFPGLPDDPTARIQPTGDDRRAIAVLAEMAVRFDVANLEWQAYLAEAPAENQEELSALRLRYAREPLEQKAGELWAKARGVLVHLRAFFKTHDPNQIGTDAFWSQQDVRDAVKQQEHELNLELQQAHDALDALADPGLAVTAWATAVRTGSSPQALYANEPPPPAAPPSGKGEKGNGKPASNGGGANPPGGAAPAPGDGRRLPPDGDADGGKAPGEKGPGEKAPGEKAPGEKAPGEKAPGEKAPGETGPGAKGAGAGDPPAGAGKPEGGTDAPEGGAPPGSPGRGPGPAGPPGPAPTR